ncbi:RNA-binding protein [Haloferax mediterranei ATCC 33500]|uniref:PUA domain-containing protein n=1 Tax=Haloferax mediterranei (strain ATCC 33500 / DSM 1411 / JCM 8866 / NBRC 14739 / NCIMB 2177 / R-4) TaxID=523841 RepID=I3R1I2_HALMT|nr:RNA-binding protein [Haloferax mediterranei]AFK18092.1 PUA domain-containing protein [Haloferax mediterranei ATCC 33500]EMA02635.1 RNA-binding protein [Haloferax mediterranei ATCC 33500]MDX5988182.1 RNA-binding protein [Haloferax mediterranei ATCC 33500]QCQ74627.1 RNA-binding protein [Haloferax mediterranei ATCC 33500]
MKVKSRHHLRSDEIDALCESIESSLGVRLDGDAFEAVEFADADYDIVLVDGEPAVMYIDDQPFLTVKGANQFPPTTNVVTVDAGAVSFVSSGADVMRPGITEADESIEAGDLVAIAEENHSKVLAVGRALEDGDDLVGDSGKVVESIHHVGDDLFDFSV